LRLRKGLKRAIIKWARRCSKVVEAELRNVRGVCPNIRVEEVANKAASTVKYCELKNRVKSFKIVEEEGW
jgi:hypothetical protein